MLPTKASVSALQKSKRRAGVRLRRICLFGLSPACVRALGQLLGRHFYLLIARDADELLSIVRSQEPLDGLVLDPELSGPDTTELIRAVRSVGAIGSKGLPMPIFVFTFGDHSFAQSDLESLKLEGSFQKPGDICKLAGAIHGELDSKDGGNEAEAFGKGPEAVIVRAMSYIEQNLVSLESSAEMSRHLGVTREHLSRQFTRYTGYTLWDFVTECRVQKAKEMLKKKDLLVKQISREVGFKCESSFFRAFTRKTGLTPEGFRRELKDRGDHIPDTHD